ncbi:MAG: TIGR02147 family protein, partial [Fibrobacteria bacterium]
MNAAKPAPEILHYSNYRTFLLDYYEYKKAEQPIFSHRYFSQKAGLSSPNYLKLVMDGKRNLTKKSLVKFAAALGLKGSRADFFENLVFFNQATALPERNLYYGNILRVRAKAGLRKLDEAQFQLFSDWRHIVVRELAAAKGFRPDARWIAKKLGKVISEKEAEESLQLLSILGLLKKTANGF